MAIKTATWLAATTECDFHSYLAGLRATNFATVDAVFSDLISYALSQGFTEAQARNALESLFRTYLSQWVLYLFIGAGDISTSIQNDATLPWLNTLVAGVSIRQRLLNRLA